MMLQPDMVKSHGEFVRNRTSMEKNCIIEGKEKGQNTILNAIRNTVSMMDTSGDRFIEQGDSVIFPRSGFCFHKSFVKRFKGMTFIRAKQKMKHQFTHAQKDDIVHYLKAKGIVKN